MRNSMGGIDLWTRQFADYRADMRKLFLGKDLRRVANFAPA